MDFIAVTIYTSHDGIEPVTGRLYTLGINGVEIEDKGDFDEFLAENTPNWDYVDEELAKKMSGETKVKAYLADNASGRETLEYIRQSMGELKKLDRDGDFGRLEIAVSGASEEDWANNWKQYYKPTRIGGRVVIVPEWEDYKAGAGDVVVIMNPGAAFGTGTHETTRLCIEYLEELTAGGASMLDIGTGSGILAVTALKLGAGSALGIDIDELAAKVAAENAGRNGVGDRFKSIKGNLADDVTGRYDIITANIVADVIMALAPDVPRHLEKNGIFIASGIIDSRAREVREKLTECGLNIISGKQERNWCAFACKVAEEK